MTIYSSTTIVLTGDQTIRELQRAYAFWVLKQCGGNKRQTCQRLGIAFHTLQGYLRRGGVVKAKAA
jgi:DNA-binding NtrC family response regulator